MNQKANTILLVEDDDDTGQEAERLQKAFGERGHHGVQLEVSIGRAERGGRVVADDAGADLHHALADDGVHFPRHD